MTILTREAILELSISERIDLIGLIWDTLAETPEQVPLTDEQKAEIDKRIASYHSNPDDILTLREVKALLKI